MDLHPHSSHRHTLLAPTLYVVAFTIRIDGKPATIRSLPQTRKSAAKRILRRVRATQPGARIETAHCPCCAAIARHHPGAWREYRRTGRDPFEAWA